MNFPTFINKWIIGFKPIKYTIFWYWFRLINHDGWRLDDHTRYWDFWMNVNDGWNEINYKYEFEKFWGKGAKVETMYVSAEDYDALVERLNQPPDPKVVERVREIMSKKAPWEVEE